MKLFVDDIRHIPDDTWVAAKTINAAISFIDTFSEQIEVISLDHDISHQVSVGTTSRPYPCDDTFTAVAYFIREKYKEAIMYKSLKKDGIHMAPEPKMPKIIVHTSNPAGAVKIMGLLSDFEVERREAGFANRLELNV